MAWKILIALIPSIAAFVLGLVSYIFISPLPILLLIDGSVVPMSRVNIRELHGEIEGIYEENEQLRSQNTFLELTNENLENERDYYQERVRNFDSIETVFISPIDISVVYNDQQMQLEDGTQAFIMEDGAFLSIVAIGEILSYSFDWDESTSRVYIDSEIPSIPDSSEPIEPNEERFILNRHV